MTTQTAPPCTCGCAAHPGRRTMWPVNETTSSGASPAAAKALEAHTRAAAAVDAANDAVAAAVAAYQAWWDAADEDTRSRGGRRIGLLRTDTEGARLARQVRAARAKAGDAMEAELGARQVMRAEQHKATQAAITATNTTQGEA